MTQTNNPQPEPAEGTVGPGGDWQTVNQVSPDSEPVATELKSNEEIVGEVLAGLWGRGRDRSERLTKAGYNPKEISELIAKRFG